MPKLELQDLVFSYQPNATLFGGFSFACAVESDQRGKIVMVMGPSGCGKTTLLRIIGKTLTPRSGRVAFSPELPRISYMSQDPVIFEHLSSLENASYFRRTQAGAPFFDQVLFARMTERLRMARVLEQARAASTLSGGERRRIALLRALSTNPHVLLLDEPCAGLDFAVKIEFLEILREVVDELQLLVLYVTHQFDEVELVGDDVLYLQPGEGGTISQVAPVPVSEVLSAPATIDLARLAMRPTGNVLRVRVNANGRELLANGGRVVATALRNIEPGEYDIVFPPSSVLWGDGAVGVPISVCGRSSSFWIVRCGESSVVGPIATTSPESFTIVGPAVLFDCVRRISGRAIDLLGVHRQT